MSQGPRLDVTPVESGVWLAGAGQPAGEQRGTDVAVRGVRLFDAVTGPGDEIPVPPGCRRLDLELKRALVNGAPGAVSMRDGKPFSVAGFTVRGGRIVAMDILVDPERLRALDLTALES